MTLRRRPRSAAVLRLAYRVGFWALLAWARVAHPPFRGVKCLLLDESGRALFVRHNYGDRRVWEIPGGGAHRGETFAETAAREAREELGAEASAWRELGTVRGRWHGRDETIGVFSARWPGGPVRPDPVEIAEVGWFALDRPPAPLGPLSVATLDLAKCSMVEPLNTSAPAA